MSEAFEEKELLGESGATSTHARVRKPLATQDGVSAQLALAALTSAIPLFVDRSIRQFELASSLLVGISCRIAARKPYEAAVHQLHSAGSVQPEPLDVLEVLQTDRANSVEPEETKPDFGGQPTEAVRESELGVPGYDSLAASQVVPRLAMLSSADLRAILAYEQAHRRRQTIMNRTNELLESSSDDSK